MIGHSLGRMDISPIFLPHFRLYEVVSLHVCGSPYKYRKILEMLPQLIKLCDPWGAGSMILTPCPYDPIMAARSGGHQSG